MNIRDAGPGDSPLLSALYVRSVQAIGAAAYSAEQVRVWSALAPSADRLDALLADGRIRLVAADDTGRPLAFADLEADGHIHFLYAAPEAAGTGMVAALYAELERRARAAGMTRLHAEASEAARRFFLRQDFAELARRDFVVDGVPIHNYAVEKRLTGA